MISAAWDIDNAYDRYLNNPEEDSYDLIKKLGLDEETSKKSAEVRNQLIRDIIEEKITGSFADRFN